MGVCKEFEVNPKVNRWFFVNTHVLMLCRRWMISNAYFGLNSSFGCENFTIVQNLQKKHDDMYTAISPLKNAKVIKNYGTFTDPVEHVEIFNDSVTFQVQGMDTKVYNVLNGKVVFAGESKTLGKVVVMFHANHLHTIYARLDKIAPYVKVGRKIKRGHVLGRVKKNLIFQVTKDSKNMNPMGFLP